MTTIFWQKCLLQDPVTKKFLVLQRTDYAKDGGLRDIPGGQVHFGEDAKEAIRREVLEETGMVAWVVTPLDVHSRLFTEERWFIFTLRVCTDVVVPAQGIVLSEEHSQYARVDGEALLALPMRDTVEFVKPVIKAYM